ncbi:hypothetical protein G7Z17_g2022 [Cylindrodendrum hubeiense]|uniref:Monocarboxylate transporter n=1 Tax=Cylindrodendrum hubeiense TaxID=595255 RepID=A0A9P5HP29_9HYPO|nr:hypothetical protein G7Z17_g2022 [Cylindrodendrum hubeiense]
MDETVIEEASAPVAEAYPEHGLKAHSVTIGAWLTLFPASGLLNSAGTFQAYLLENELAGYSESKVGWIFIALVVSLVCTSFCKSYDQFMLSFSVLGGIASSILWTSSIATLGHWFQLNRGLATGLATTAGGFGGVVYPILFNQLTPQIGFAWTMRCFALLSAFCFILGLLLLKTRLPQNKKARLLLDWHGFKDLRFVLTMSAIFILDWAVLVPPAYITTYSTSHGLRSISPHILAILNAASIFGRGIPGLAADRLGRFNIMILCSAMCILEIAANKKIFQVLQEAENDLGTETLAEETGIEVPLLGRFMRHFAAHRVVNYSQ